MANNAQGGTINGTGPGFNTTTSLGGTSGATHGTPAAQGYTIFTDVVSNLVCCSSGESGSPGNVDGGGATAA